MQLCATNNAEIKLVENPENSEFYGTLSLLKKKKKSYSIILILID